jgi:hypothetical protein
VRHPELLHPGIATGSLPSLGDFDDDGWPDIYLACDSTPSLLFINNRDGTFREEGAIRGIAHGEDGQEQAGMGVAVGDYDLDGRLDIFKTNFEGDTPYLYRNIGNANFEEASAGSPISTTMASPTCSWWPDSLFRKSRNAALSFPRKILECFSGASGRDDSKSLRARRDSGPRAPQRPRLRLRRFR